ncbi:MAG: alpha/beta fold hydrolase, partial [Paenibacillus sp.]|nr:alpha/beta fold hydrolase [Paenibacillus sp.]
MSYNLYELNRRGLPKLLDGIDSPADWQQKKNRIQQLWLDSIGGEPERVPVSYTIDGEHKEQDHTRYHLVYDTVYGDKVTAFLLVPDDDVSGKSEDGRRPAIIALHPTN